MDELEYVPVIKVYPRKFGVIAIDPSLTRCGIAKLEVNGADIILRKLMRVETLPDHKSPIRRQMYISHVVESLIDYEEPFIGVIEAPTYGAKKSETMHALFSLCFKVVSDKFPVVLVAPSPSHFKFYLKGLGEELGIMEFKGVKDRAKKVFMRLFPLMIPAGRCLSDDEAEAALMGVMGVHLFRILSGNLKISELTPYEHQIFAAKNKGIIYREGQFMYTSVGVEPGMAKAIFATQKTKMVRI